MLLLKPVEEFFLASDGSLTVFGDLWREAVKLQSLLLSSLGVLSVSLSSCGCLLIRTTVILD